MTAPVPPRSCIGILGAGQLGRMTALAAARLGYRAHIYGPEMDAPALQVTPLHTCGAFDDHGALRRFASACDVVTLEWENVPLAALETVARHTRLHPGVEVLRVAQDRVAEKTFAQRHGIGTARFAAVDSVEALEAALRVFPRPAILKSTRFGYDGKGQVTIDMGTEASVAWAAMGSTHGILESFVDFACEVSVIVARAEDGRTACFPVTENIHRHHVLAESHAPARIAPDVATEALALAERMAEALGVVGLLGVEMFVLKQPDEQGRRVYLNEIAPRPHNSGHWTMDACACSQFEQLVRAVCGLPLGATVPHSRARMENILGSDVERWAARLADPAASLHLYGKAEAKTGRKMGHVTWLTGPWGGEDHSVTIM